tara:strand:- start:690 stop:947 length:258 start_codon:yes stop_codon:yes gene_type:complete
MPQQSPRHNNKNFKLNEKVAILVKNFWSVLQPTVHSVLQLRVQVPHPPTQAPHTTQESPPHPSPLLGGIHPDMSGVMFINKIKSL